MFKNFVSKTKQKTLAVVSKIKQKTLAVTTAAIAVMSLGASSAFASTPPSTATDFSSVGDIGITTTDIVSTGFSFVRLFNNYTTLILGVILVPTIIGLIIWLWRKLPKPGSGRA